MDIITIKGKGKEIELKLLPDATLAEIRDGLVSLNKNNPEFFVKTNAAVSYSGKDFDYFEETEFEKAVKDIFGKRASLVRKQSLTNEQISHTLDKNERICKVVRKSIRSGNVETSRGDMIVYGDVNPGAEVIAMGSITILGSLRGIAQVTGKGSVFALNMKPSQIRIGNLYSYNKKNFNAGTAIAKVEKGKIVIKSI